MLAKRSAESLGNRRRPRLRSDARGCFVVTEIDVREHTCAPVCNHPGWLAKRFAMPSNVLDYLDPGSRQCRYRLIRHDDRKVRFGLPGRCEGKG